MDATLYATMNKFIGIENTDDPTRLKPVILDREYAFPLQQANNMEIDDTYGISSRHGYEHLVAGTDIHSLWSDDDTCLFVDETTLYQLMEDYSVVALLAGVAHAARMSYAPFNDRVYCTNGTQIGYVKSLTYTALVDPLLEFKQPLPAGQLIESYRGCPYVAVKNILYVSDPLCDYYDIRTGYRIFTSDIRLLRAVDDGLYVGDDKVWWVRGDANEDFERTEAYAFAPILYTDVRADGQHVGDGMKGKVAIWTGENGICVGGNDGIVANLTEQRFVFEPHGRGAGFIREIDNTRHYVNTLY